MICEACGHDIQIGEWAFCPHGGAMIGRGADVTWPGGKTFENLANEPVTFYSKSEYQKYLRTHHIEECVRHVPVPGSDKSPHTTSWATMDPYTLDAAKALVTRTGTAKDMPHPGWVQSMTVTVTEESGTIRAPQGTFDAA